jgi:hypothetical protein
MAAVGIDDKHLAVEVDERVQGRVAFLNHNVKLSD